ncbi:MAG: GntR family transcriptional regulator [Alphaproteobacteria bacterium]|nr:GntR family transcriptional regulator [Alphaproteobacteria bacterium]
MAARPPRRTGQAGERQARAGAGRGRRVVYDRIKTDILTLVLQPGQDIDEVSLSRRYGVSRTPIREALILLSSDGLVSFGQNRRASVTPLIIADYPRYIEALDLTRRAVSRLAAARRHDIELPKLREAEAAFARAARGSNVASEALANRLLPVEMALQLRVAETGHNGYLTQSYDRLLTLGQRMLRVPYAYDPHPGEPVDVFVRRVVKRHGDLVGAIEAGDADGAEAEAHALVVDLVKRLRSYFEENLTLGLAMGVEPQRGAASGLMEDVVVGKRPTGGSGNGD